MHRLIKTFTLLASLGATAAGAAPTGKAFGDAEPVLDTNNSVRGGCPIESANGRFLYMASNRDGVLGDLDIWRAERKSPRKPYGPAENLGAPINSAASDFCPTPLPGGILFFVSSRAHENACGCAGIFSAPLAIELYTRIFDSNDALDKLEAFASFNGADFYGLPRNSDTITLEKKSWTVPDDYPLAEDRIIPLHAGEKESWSIVT